MSRKIEDDKEIIMITESKFDIFPDIVTLWTASIKMLPERHIITPVGVRFDFNAIQWSRGPLSMCHNSTLIQTILNPRQYR